MVRIGIIGNDEKIYKHASTIMNIKGFDFKGFYCSNGKFSGRRKPKIRINRFLSHEELLDSVDAIDITNNGPSLYELAVSALKKSKHLYIFPSLLKTYDQAKGLIKLANEANVTLMVQRTAKYNAVLNTILEGLSDLRLVDIQHHMGNGTGKSDLSVFSIILRNLDILHAIIKSNSNNIKACGVCIVNKNPDIINARIEFDNGCIANLNCSKIALKSSHIATIIQNSKIIKVDFNSNKAQILHPEKANNNTDYKLRARTFKVSPNNPLSDEFTHFRDSIINSTKSLANIEDGFKSLQLAHKIFEKVHKS